MGEQRGLAPLLTVDLAPVTVELNLRESGARFPCKWSSVLEIYTELVNPVYNRNGNQVTASLAVKYLDNQTMTTQVSQFDLVLEKNGENWKIVG